MSTNEAAGMCSTCMRVIPIDAPAGLCPHCLMSRGADPQEAPHASVQRFGPYQIESEIKRGGMGVVYRARHVTLGRLVALKTLVGGSWSGDHLLRLFRDEPALASDLEHPHIVPIFEVGEHEGQPYYAMRLMAGNLADHGGAFKGQPRKAARVLITVARAIDFGHKRGVLHCDVKPENILLDEEDQPFVGDFGLARRLGSPRQNPAGGTPGYMAPEQAGQQADATVAVDVWGLGAVLYDLVCGQTPFPAKADPDSLGRLRDESPPRPRALVPRLDVGFEAIVLKCLEKAPERRYESAAALADDLEHWLAGEPLLAHQATTVARLGRWCRRHPLVAGGSVAMFCFVAVLAAAYAREARSLEIDLRRETLRTNAWAARAQAGAVESKLRVLGDLIEDIARDAELIRSLGSATSPPAVLASAWRPAHGDRFDSISVLDRQGTLLARWPAVAGHVGRDFSFRGYFVGAIERARQGRAGFYTTGAYQSKIDGAIRFAVSAPVKAASGSIVGVILGGLRADSLRVSMVIPEGVDVALHPDRARPRDDGPRKVTLVARRDQDRDRRQDGARAEWVVIQHEELSPGPAVVATSPVLDALDAHHASRFDDDAYIDPITGGRWLAGFAPLPGVPWVVIVQTREGAVTASNQRLVYRIGRAAFLAAGAGLVVGLASYILARGRTSRAPGA